MAELAAKYDTRMRDLVLIGGGHTHALVLKHWADNPPAHTRLRLITPARTAPYSGMLPGFVAGHYSRSELDIDMARLARRAGADLILGAVDAIDTTRREISVTGQAPVRYDIASINSGIRSAELKATSPFDVTVPVKPLGPFAQRWQDYMHSEDPARITIVGAGVAGVEIALAMAHALNRTQRDVQITLIDRSTALKGLPDRATWRLKQDLVTHYVTVREFCRIASVTETAVILDTGEQIPTDFLLSCTGATAPDWLANTGLALENGFLRVSPYLQTSDPAIFAAGDVAHMDHAPRPKAGVYAVRQAPALARNLSDAIGGRAPSATYHPQKDFLKLVSRGGKSALAQRGRFAIWLPGLWFLKNRIDRNFMRGFETL